MLQYLLNATAIWLISLVSYDIFLRKESYHNYNRFYLLFTFMLGIVLPAVQWQSGMAYYPPRLEKPIERVINAKRNVVEVTAASASINWGQWLLIIYIGGMLVALILLLVEIRNLASFYSYSNKYKDGDSIIIETGKVHAPFSFLNIFFVSSRVQYTDEEWSMILVHEGRHRSLMHTIDLILIQVAKIIFWFHPLVYVYSMRLLLVHEYQADSVSARQPEVYGRFLVEQSILQASPAISHSFNRSPIKKRILMLTRKSNTLARSKMLVFIPVALVCFFCFSKNSLSQTFVRKGNIVTWRGNTFELSELTYDTVILVDPVTGGEITKIKQNDPVPIKMNGVDIPGWVDKDPYFTGTGVDLRDYLLVGMKDVLSKLDDGLYTLDINEVLIDEHGSVVYFEYSEMKRSRTADEVKATPKPHEPVIINSKDPDIKVRFGGSSGAQNGTFTLTKNTDPAFYEVVSKSNQDAIFKKLCELMEVAPAFIPGTLNGKNVVSRYNLMKFINHFKVKDHKLYDLDKKTMDFKEL